jgi:hypothetical protein
VKKWWCKLGGHVNIRPTRSAYDSSRKSFSCGYFCLARATGLEPATTGSTGRYSNQLSYAPKLFINIGLRCFLISPQIRCTTATIQAVMRRPEHHYRPGRVSTVNWV